MVQQESRNLNIKMIVFDKDGTLGDCAPSMQNWCEGMTKCIINDYISNSGSFLSSTEHDEILRQTIDCFHKAIGWDNSNCCLEPSAPLSAGSWSDILELTREALTRCGSISNVDEKVMYWHENLGDIHANDKPLIPDLKEFMQSLKDSGFIISICTSDDRNATNSCIRNWGLDNIIDFSICGDEVTESKPSAYPLLTLCKQANISPEECIIVGDTSADTGMGRNANAALIVGVLTGSGTTEQLLKTGAHIVLPDISYLKQCLIPQKSLENDFGESFETIVVSKIQA